MAVGVMTVLPSPVPRIRPMAGCPRAVVPLGSPSSFCRWLPPPIPLAGGMARQGLPAPGSPFSFGFLSDWASLADGTRTA